MAQIDVTYEGGTSVELLYNEHAIKTDLEGRFSPTDLFAASLGACFMTVLSLSAKRLNVDITGSELKVIKQMSQDLPRRVRKLEIYFTCPNEFSNEIEEQLEKSAKHCPIHYSLHPELEQNFFFKWGGG